MNIVSWNGSLQPSRFLAEWRKSGVIKLDALLSTQEVMELRDFVAEIYELLSQEMTRNTAALNKIYPTLTDNFQKWRGIYLKPLPQFLRQFSPGLLQSHDRIVMGISTHVRHIFEASLFGLPRWSFAPSKSFFRRINKNSASGVPWHTDAEAAGIAQSANRCFNVWIPLRDVGSDAPTLEFVPGSHRITRAEPIPLDIRNRPDGQYRDTDWVQSLQKPTWAPSISLGDAVIFDQYTLHRTAKISGSSEERASCEFRFIDMPMSLPKIAMSTLRSDLKAHAARLRRSISSFQKW